MDERLTYRELEKDIIELQIENETLGLNLTIQSKERQKRAAELVIANVELEYQRGEKKKRAAELSIANIELEYQRGEKKKRAAELVIANVELDFQNEEKAKRASELALANIELDFQNEEKAKRATELTIANLAVVLQSELIVAKDKAEENEIYLSKLNATKDKLFTIIAHDLRSPFNCILGFTELLIENFKDYEEAEVEAFLTKISLSAQNTLVLLENLLNWAKSKTGQIDVKPEKVVLSSVVQEIFELSSLSAKNKDIVLNYAYLEEIIIFADLNMLKTIIRNLISNAIKFTNTDGQILVTASKKGKFIEIAVSDNGVGMDEGIRNKLFRQETHQTTLGTAGENGSGLGLMLCKEFVEKQGGEIWVQSVLGKGSVFRFSLPLN
jgi:signal transduction histidine kinase